jgi:hypothetical protein
MSDGSWTKWRTPGMRGTTTCTNGTICDSWRTMQGDGTWGPWNYECTYSPARTTLGPQLATGVRPDVRG